MCDLVASSGQKVSGLRCKRRHVSDVPLDRRGPCRPRLPCKPFTLSVILLTHPPPTHVSPGQGEASHLFPGHRGGRGAVPGLIVGASADGYTLQIATERLGDSVHLQ